MMIITTTIIVMFNSSNTNNNVNTNTTNNGMQPAGLRKHCYNGLTVCCVRLTVVACPEGDAFDKMGRCE